MDSKEQNPTFTKLVHVGIVIKDLDQTMKDLSDLGLGPFLRPAPMHEQPLYKGKPGEAKMKSAIVKIGEAELELTQPVEGESPQMEYFLSKGEGIHHLGFLVDDLDKTVEEIESKGHTLLLYGKDEATGWAYFDVGTSGLILQFIQSLNKNFVHQKVSD